MRALNDKLMMQDVLAHLRDLMTAAHMGITHSNCPKVRDAMTKTLERTTDKQYEVFKYMNQHGMYPVKNASDSEIKQILTLHGCPV